MINKKLLKLYKSNWQILSKELENIKDNSVYKVKPSNPLLLSVNESYLNTDIKIMVIGQETNGWYEECSGIEEIRKAYNKFFWTGRCFERGGQFWNGVNQFKKMLHNKYKDKQIGLIWNNVIKIGKAKGKNKPPPYIRQIEQKYFYVLAKEIEIIKPDIILFLSGPNYDSMIKEHFPDVKYEAMSSVKTRQLAKLKIDGFKNCFRTYHPNYLYRSKNLNDFFESIINEIKL